VKNKKNADKGVRDEKYGSKMYDDLDQGDNNQWKFCFSRSIFRYQKQLYELLFQDALAEFENQGGVNKVTKYVMDKKVGELLEQILGPANSLKLEEGLKA